MLDALDDSLVELAAVGQLAREGGVWAPLRGCSGGRLLHHLVNLFQGKTLGLRHQEVGVDEGACAETSPNEKDTGLEVSSVGSDHVRGNDGDWMKVSDYIINN